MQIKHFLRRLFKLDPKPAPTLGTLIKQLGELQEPKEITIKYNLIRGRVEIDPETLGILEALDIDPSKLLPKPRVASKR